MPAVESKDSAEYGETVRGLFWFRNDLRLHDHPLLAEAASECDELLLLYIFDPRSDEDGTCGFPRRSERRKSFTIQGVEALRASISLRGGELTTQIGLPEEIIPRLMSELKIETLYASREIGTEEEMVVQRILQNTPTIRFKTEFSGSLIHPDEFPFSLENTPEVFTTFRKSVESALRINPPIGEPSFRSSIASKSEMPAIPEVSVDKRAVLQFEGGEAAALSRLNTYFFEGDHLRSYKETRNGLLGADFSSKLSPWLAQGSLSPRLIYSEIKRYEGERIANESTYWLFFELLWREFFRCIALKHGARLFLGLRKPGEPARFDHALFAGWCRGETGMPFIDANIRELNATGYMSNRGRQNVASFLVHDLGLPWSSGAFYFESQLLDYDVASNWGNWTYVAGVGNDPRRDRYFNILKQSARYDPEGAYIKTWCPEAAHLFPPELFNPSLYISRNP